MEHKDEHKHHEKKHEHHTEHKHHEHEHTSKNKNTKLWIMAVALGLLIVISGVQAFELVSLKNKLSDEGLTGLVEGSSKQTISTGSSSGTLNDNLDSLPSMVGGC
jgi:ABC-type nickel/cobalt efflux system permease component RcnA|tara:strand:- start:876 stop:1190 length:315 start_codon:yes stop_codon:yes gene_type:complete